MTDICLKFRKNILINTFIIYIYIYIKLIINYRCQGTYPELPTQGSVQIRIFNTMNCPVNLTIIEKEPMNVMGLSMWEELKVKVDKDSVTLNYEADFTNCKKLHYTDHTLIKGKNLYYTI